MTLYMTAWLGTVSLYSDWHVCLNYLPVLSQVSIKNPVKEKQLYDNVFEYMELD